MRRPLLGPGLGGRCSTESTGCVEKERNADGDCGWVCGWGWWYIDAGSLNEVTDGGGGRLTVLVLCCCDKVSKGFVCGTCDELACGCPTMSALNGANGALCGRGAAKPRPTA